LTPEQRDRVLALQQECARPFGALAEEFEGVAAEMVEDAWAEQYARMADWIDPRRVRIDPDVLGLIQSDEAREHGVLPLRWTDGGLIACTTRTHLVGALAFTGRRLTDLCLFAMAESDPFAQALEEHYGVPSPDRRGRLLRDTL
jgi:hypothetical protein